MDKKRLQHLAGISAVAQEEPTKLLTENRLQHLAGIPAVVQEKPKKLLNESREDANEWYRTVIRNAVNKAINMGEDGPVLDDEVEWIVDQAMQELEGGY